MSNELTTYEQKFLADAEAYSSDWQVRNGLFLSTKSGRLKFGEEELPGNQAALVVLDSIHENAFYGDKFDPDNPVPPTCYAMARKRTDLAPYPAMQDNPEWFRPQHEECAGCPKNVFGSADTGRGKACKNGARLSIIPAGIYVPERKGSKDLNLEMFIEERHYAEADVATLKVPPTSVEFWAKYVQQVIATHRVAPYAVVTRVYLEPHEKHQFHVRFEMVERLPDELAAVIMARHEEAAKTIIQPYSPPQAQDNAPKAGGLKGLRC